MPPAPPVLQVRGLSVATGDRVLVRDLDFAVDAGEVVAVAGPSGCGKSTLLRHLVGLERAPAGRVEGIAAPGLAPPAEATGAPPVPFAVMFQSGALWSSMTVGDNLRLAQRLAGIGPAADPRARAAFALALVGLPDALDRMPSDLSGGMRKRVALARALVVEPRVVFLDEPASGLDPINARLLDELIAALSRHLGMAVVMVTHAPASIRRTAHRVLYLHGGSDPRWSLGTPAEMATSDDPDIRTFFAAESAP